MRKSDGGGSASASGRERKTMGKTQAEKAICVHRCRNGSLGYLANNIVTYFHVLLVLIKLQLRTSATAATAAED